MRAHDDKGIGQSENFITGELSSRQAQRRKKRDAERKCHSAKTNCAAFRRRRRRRGVEKSSRQHRHKGESE